MENQILSKADLLKQKILQKQALQADTPNPLEELKRKKELLKLEQDQIIKDSQDASKAILISISDITPLFANGEVMHNRSGMATKDRQELERFAASLLLTKEGSLYETGLIQAITVRRSKTQEGKYELIAGFRRTEAFKINNQPHIPAIIIDVDDKTARRLRNAENKQRRNLNAYDRIYGDLEEVQLYLSFYSMEEARETIKKAKNILSGAKKATEEEKQQAQNLSLSLKELLQKELGTFVNNLKILDISEEVKKLLYENKIEQEEAQILHKIAKDKTEVIEKAIEYIDSQIEQTNKRPSVKQFENFLRGLTDTKKTNRGHQKSPFAQLKVSISQIQDKQIQNLDGEKKGKAEQLMQEIQDRITQLNNLTP